LPDSLSVSALCLLYMILHMTYAQAYDLTSSARGVLVLFLEVWFIL